MSRCYRHPGFRIFVNFQKVTQERIVDLKLRIFSTCLRIFGISEREFEYLRFVCISVLIIAILKKLNEYTGRLVFDLGPLFVIFKISIWYLHITVTHSFNADRSTEYLVSTLQSRSQIVWHLRRIIGFVIHRLVVSVNVKSAIIITWIFFFTPGSNPHQMNKNDNPSCYPRPFKTKVKHSYYVRSVKNWHAVPWKSRWFNKSLNGEQSVSNSSTWYNPGI